MRRLILYSGAVGDFDGAYNWVRPDMENDPDYSVGPHNESGWMEDHYVVVEVYTPEAE